MTRTTARTTAAIAAAAAETGIRIAVEGERTIGGRRVVIARASRAAQQAADAIHHHGARAWKIADDIAGRNRIAIDEAGPA